MGRHSSASGASTSLSSKEAETRFTDFSELDERFHRRINDASRNRFIVGFYDVISMIFHYHYQWNKQNERERNIVAMHEHLAYIDALQSRDASVVAERCNAHMATARLTLMASIRRFAELPSAYDESFISASAARPFGP